MSIDQIIMLFIALVATLYQVIKIGTIWALVKHHGYVVVKGTLIISLILCVVIQVLFVITLTGVK